MYTPGPWRQGDARKNIILGPKGEHIADCIFTHSDSAHRVNPTPLECLDNAMIIALAPEMLEALMLLVPHLMTEGEMLDEASLNEGRASYLGVASMRVLKILQKAGIK